MSTQSIILPEKSSGQRNQAIAQGCREFDMFDIQLLGLTMCLVKRTGSLACIHIFVCMTLHTYT